MMKAQIVLVGIFALNLVLSWLLIKFNWYRIVAFSISALVMLVMPLFPQPAFYLDYLVWRWVGALAIVVGLAVIIWAGRELSFCPGQLVTSGPYHYLRHPQYLGAILIFIGWCWVWAAVYAFYFGMFVLALVYLQAFLEEKLILEKKFGEQFLDYRHATGMFWIK